MNKFLAISFVALLVAELDAKDKPVSLKNVAEGKRATQSSTKGSGSASRAVDGNWDSNWTDRSCTHTRQDKNPWWEVDLGKTHTVYAVVLKNREDCCSERLAKVKVTVDKQECNYHEDAVGNDVVINCKKPISGRKVRVTLLAKQFLTLCEVNVLGV